LCWRGRGIVGSGEFAVAFAADVADLAASSGDRFVPGDCEFRLKGSDPTVPECVVVAVVINPRAGLDRTFEALSHTVHSESPR
jgi:hypothetical protein